MKKTLGLAVVLSLVFAGHVLALDAGYWVVVGNHPQEEVDGARHDRIIATVARCGFDVFNDFSFKFGFRPGYMSYVVGAYQTKAEAVAVQAAIRRCVPDAYVKKGAWAGE